MSGAATTTAKAVTGTARAVHASPKHLTIGLTLGLAGWLLIDSGVRGEAPWDRLLTIFQGSPPKARLKGATAVGSAAYGAGLIAAGGDGTGTLELYYPGHDPVGGHDGHLHFAHESRKVLLRIGRELQAQGLTVRGNESFPPIGTHSTPASLHYPQNGSKAIDVNYYGPRNEAEVLAEVAAYIRKRVNALTKAKPAQQSGSDPRQTEG